MKLYDFAPTVTDVCYVIGESFGKWHGMNVFQSFYYPNNPDRYKDIGGHNYKKAVVIGKTEAGNKLIVIEVPENTVE